MGSKIFNLLFVPQPSLLSQTQTSVQPFAFLIKVGSRPTRTDFSDGTALLTAERAIWRNLSKKDLDTKAILKCYMGRSNKSIYKHFQYLAEIFRPWEYSLHTDSLSSPHSTAAFPRHHWILHDLIATKLQLYQFTAALHPHLASFGSNCSV